MIIPAHFLSARHVSAIVYPTHIDIDHCHRDKSSDNVSEPQPMEGNMVPIAVVRLVFPTVTLISQ